MTREDNVREYIRLLRLRDWDGIDALIQRLLKGGRIEDVNVFIGLIPTT
jgi:hypothetical protein